MRKVCASVTVHPRLHHKVHTASLFQKGHRLGVGCNDPSQPTQFGTHIGQRGTLVGAQLCNSAARELKHLAHAATLATPHDAVGRPRPALDLACVAASGLVATVRDLATLWAALAPDADGAPAGRGVLSAASCAAILTPTAVDDDGAVIGLGPYLKERHGDLKYMHRGHDPGWYVHAEGLLRRRVVIVLATNATTGGDLVPGMAHALRTICYDLAL